MSYALKTAIGSLWREKWINLLCTFTISAGLLIISLTTLVVYNFHLAMRSIPDRFAVMVFLNDDIKERPSELISELKSISGVRDLRYISKDEAMEELRQAINDPEFVLEGLEDNPLPASVELKLERGSVNDREVMAIVKQAEAFEQVDEVHYASKVLKVIQSARRYAEGLGLGLVAAIAMAVIFVSYSTVKILLYRKQDEINTLKYLGATKGFIRAPFLIEGAGLGLMAGLCALGGIGLAWTGLISKAHGLLPILDSITFPLAILPAIPATGLVIGMTGALLAVGRIRF